MRWARVTMFAACSLMCLSATSCKTGGQGQGEGPEEPEEPEDKRPRGKQGDVCAVGLAEGGPTTTVHACGRNLSCCYPCGIDGCNSVCATAKECEAWRTLP